MTAVIPTLTTKRLNLRPMRLEDWPDFAGCLCSDRAIWMGGPYDTHGAWGMFCADQAQWAFFGCGALMIEQAQTGTCIGQIGINFGPLFPEYELGWLLYDGHERQGYAHEAAHAMRDWARDQRGLPALVSYIAPENARPIALAKRLGALLDPDAPCNDPADLVFRHY